MGSQAKAQAHRIIFRGIREIGSQSSSGIRSSANHPQALSKYNYLKIFLVVGIQILNRRFGAVFER